MWNTLQMRVMTATWGNWWEKFLKKYFKEKRWHQNCVLGLLHERTDEKHFKVMLNPNILRTKDDKRILHGNVDVKNSLKNTFEGVQH